MQKNVLIGLIGDYDATVPAHQAIPIALQLAADSAAMEVKLQWVPTEEVRSVARVSEFDGLWCVPASPYRNMEGALLAIQYARESGRPFLGTCGGFQHAVIEYARNVLGWADAEHAETAPDGARNPLTTHDRHIDARLDRSLAERAKTLGWALRGVCTSPSSWDLHTVDLDFDALVIERRDRGLTHYSSFGADAARALTKLVASPIGDQDQFELSTWNGVSYLRRNGEFIRSNLA